MRQKYGTVRTLVISTVNIEHSTPTSGAGFMVWIVVFWVQTPCNIANANVSEQHTASTFTAEGFQWNVLDHLPFCTVS